jgi:hypothetical protein
MFEFDILPFEGPAYVLWGGDTKEQNYHIANPLQKHAIDFVSIPSPVLRYSGDGTQNEHYAIWKRPILAPAAGTIIEAIDGIRDNKPKEMNNYMVMGNMIIIRHTDQVFSVLCHLACGSVSVRAGDRVDASTRIALCGNSGRSSEPHLHFHAQSTDHFNSAEAVKSVFRRMRVENTIMDRHSPLKFDITENTNG